MNRKLSEKNNVEKFRVESELSQRELAILIGVSTEMIVSIENGSFIPDVRLALTISTELNRKFGEVFFFKNESKIF
ncbi:helix-turn-helix domain-containing protein [Parvimonas sp. D2]|uniref:helix-turn-helix transcriptional regulator n=1 Tax=unclassified Parvimonas TaxID=1151464 RepID=UPI00020DCB52|nr:MULTISPECIES: helix-turn-helix domain-containing protein [unclassified Parvimonas]EGL38477.1 DNA-binding helix-turn-helix protein [Parvimonas sp. oral taxon 110 str. F0139]MEB3011393.1 helix-turn-helix domain-containing protein [Parvimonas sp. D2]MEB3086885.1 helix-turn-helix domain-containing protein [Parvimonas sp. D4]